MRYSSKGASAHEDVHVCVKLPNGKICEFHVTPPTTIGTVCRLVADKEGYNVDRLNVKYTGKTLDKSHSVQYLGVCEETVLKLEVIEPKRLSVTVNIAKDEAITVEVENISSMMCIKDAIELQKSIPTDKQTLKLRGRLLSNMTQRVMDAGITHGCTLDLVISEKKTKPAEDSTNATADNLPADFDKDAVLNTFAADAEKPIEVVFSFDTTGSMYSCLEQVRLKLKDTVTRLIEEIPRIRIALIAHGDYCDCTSAYVSKTIDFTNDVTSLVNFAQTVQKTGGGDAPECYEWVLCEAGQLDWSEDSAKALVIIGDDVPHPPSMTDQAVHWKQEMQLLKGQGVKIYGVRAQHQQQAAPFYECLSEYTGGAYIEFRNFSVITDMFLAVCYKCAGEEQFNEFVEEVERRAVNHDDVSQGSTNEVKHVLEQMERADAAQQDVQEDSAEIPDRWTIAQPWWNPEKYDKETNPSYSYNPQSREWTKLGGNGTPYKAGGYVAPPAKSADYIAPPPVLGDIPKFTGPAPIELPVTLYPGGKRPVSVNINKTKRKCTIM